MAVNFISLVLTFKCQVQELRTQFFIDFLLSIYKCRRLKDNYETCDYSYEFILLDLSLMCLVEEVQNTIFD